MFTVEYLKPSEHASAMTKENKASMTIYYRAATIEDFPAIVVFFEEELQRSANRTYIREALLNYPAGLAFDEDELIGFIYCGYMAPDVLELANIVIAEKYRSQGIGTELLKYTEKLIAVQAKAILLTNSSLYGNNKGKRNAENFYLSNGYTQINLTGETNLYWKNLADLR